ncbi:putative major intrinsic protein [Helianthus annuus]|nr:putative major intrinsic protein [Helianthus annuus]KAJ0637923.1 putative major intrinsic protein [Helianthus annuus]KAJ0669415.1 putative major intrinsic protein [Helianthus annuus]
MTKLVTILSTNLVAVARFTTVSSSVVPSYISAQLLGSILASGTLCLLFDVEQKHFFGTLPTGSNVRSLVLEIIISFLLMFVISGVATDNRATGELAGIAIGMTILMNVLLAGYSLFHDKG